MRDYTVRAVQDAYLLLSCFNYYDTNLSLGEFESRSGLPKSKVFRLLKTLEALDFVNQDSATGHYRLGSAALLLGRVSRHSAYVKVAIASMLQNIAAVCNETVNFASIQGRSLVYSVILESPSPFRVTEHIGDIASWEHTALGRAILAYHPKPRMFLPAERMRMLSTVLEAVRRTGYAIDDEETERGVRCVGVPVRDGQDVVIGGCSISAPAVRFPQERVHQMGSLLVERARVVHQQLRENFEVLSDPIGTL